MENKTPIPSKPEIARMLGQVVGLPENQKKMAELGYKLTPTDLTNIVNKTYKQLMEATVPTQQPFWIIVSDEGHAAIPTRHTSKDSAEKEAQRLTEMKPGITFTVFEAKSSVFTPKAVTQKTEFDSPRYSYFPTVFGAGYGGVRV